MCGIVGYVGPGSSIEVLLGGLKRLEYRGYDSAGVAVLDDDGAIGSRKHAGKLGILVDDLAANPLADGHTGIGHTRWATHGGPTDGNAHPHLGDDGKLALIHNGIIENFAELKHELLDAGDDLHERDRHRGRGAARRRAYRETGDLTEALRATVARLEGAFTLLVMHQDVPGVVVGARRNSPLVIGLGDGENFLGSDVAAFVEHTRRAMEIGQDQIVTIRPDSVEVIDFDGNPARPGVRGRLGRLRRREGRLAELHEEGDQRGARGRREHPPRARHDGASRCTELDAVADMLTDIDRVVVLACGTAAYAGMLGKYAIEAWARIPVDVELSHEFRYRDPVLDERTLVVSVSQSGETMDTLMAVKYARERGARTVSICNTQGATIPRESDAVLYTHAGPEVAVASTKAFVAQVTALYLFGLHLADLRGTLDAATGSRSSSPSSRRCPRSSRRSSSRRRRKVEQLAHWMGDTQSVLFLGRHVGYPIALEGALKLKELAYIHAEGFAAGELKHGPIALIEPGQVVFVVVPSPRDPKSLHPKVVSNIQEIRARGARVIAIAEIGDVAVLPFADEVIRIPLAAPFFEPLLAVVPLHVFAMELATAKGLDVDQPRNLAKSVTVE